MIDDEQLTLYYYGDELAPQQQATVARALAGDAALAARYARLATDLEALRPADGTLQAPTLAAARWRQALASAPDAERPAPRMRGAWLALAAAVGATVVGLALLRSGPDAAQTQRAPTIATLPHTAQPEPVAAITTHLRNTQLTLAGLREPASAGPDRQLRELLAQNRIAEQRAEAAGAKDLARLLRAFGRDLEQLAAGDTDVGRRRQLESEVGATLTRLTGRASNPVYEL